MIEHCTVREFCRRHGIGRTTFYKLVRSGTLHVVKLGPKTLVPSDSENEWSASLPRPHFRPHLDRDLRRPPANGGDRGRM